MAVTAPKCPLCKSVHWQREPHVWTDGEPVEKAPTHRIGAFRKPLEARKPSAVSDPSSVPTGRLDQMEARLEVLERSHAVLLAAIAVSTESANSANSANRLPANNTRPANTVMKKTAQVGKTESPAGRKTYQRDLMRKRRAAKKAGS